MTNLTTTRATNRSTFANREGREVVIEHELLGIFFAESIDALFIATRTKRDCCQCLGFATLKYCRTVCSRQHVDRALDVPQLVCSTPILANTSNDQLTYNLLFQVVPGFREAIRGDRSIGIRIWNRGRNRFVAEC